MGILYFFESIRSPVLDQIMSLITHLGEEAVFLVAALLIFWCVDINRGYYLMAVGFVGTILNQFLKLVFRIPRPWVKDPNFTIVESARAAATGYSFPSGHTQNVVGTFAAISITTRHNWLRAAAWIPVILVPISRMYLGVHTPLDVGVSFVLALVLVFLLHPLFADADRNPGRLYLILLIMAAAAASYVLFVEFFPFPADIDPDNYAEGVKNAYSLLGAVLGVNVAHFIDDRFLRFDTAAPIGGQALKLIIGFAVVLAVKEGLKPLLNMLFGGHLASNALRYFAVVIVAGCLWPACFPLFSRGCRR